MYICALDVYLMKTVLLRLNIITDRAIGAPCHGKFIVGGPNTIYQRYLRERMNSVLKNITTTGQGLSIIKYASNISTVII